MPDRHQRKKKWGEHPPYCTCESCDALRRGVEDPKAVRRRSSELTSSSAIEEAFRVLNRTEDSHSAEPTVTGDSTKRPKTQADDIATERPSKEDTEPSPGTSYPETRSRSKKLHARPTAKTTHSSRVRGQTSSATPPNEAGDWSKRQRNVDSWIAEAFHDSHIRSSLRSIGSEIPRMMLALLVGAAIAVFLLYPVLPKDIQREIDDIQSRLAASADSEQHS